MSKRFEFLIVAMAFLAGCVTPYTKTAKEFNDYGWSVQNKANAEYEIYGKAKFRYQTCLFVEPHDLFREYQKIRLATLVKACNFCKEKGIKNFKVVNEESNLSWTYLTQRLKFGVRWCSVVGIFLPWNETIDVNLRIKPIDDTEANEKTWGIVNVDAFLMNHLAIQDWQITPDESVSYPFMNYLDLCSKNKKELKAYVVLAKTWVHLEKIDGTEIKKRFL